MIFRIILSWLLARRIYYVLLLCLLDGTFELEL